jgi:hypothetical protein
MSKIDCGKSESGLGLLYEQFFTPLASPPGFRPGARIHKEEKPLKNCCFGYPVQPIDKSRFGRENPSKTKTIQ